MDSAHLGIPSLHAGRYLHSFRHGGDGAFNAEKCVFLRKAAFPLLYLNADEVGLVMERLQRSWPDRQR